MKNEKNIKRAAYVAIVALLALILWSYWVWRRIERGETQVYFPEGAVTAISIVCAVLAYIAIGYVAFIIVRVFYLGLTKPKSREKHDHAA
jgi:hypothetical protein